MDCKNLKINARLPILLSTEEVANILSMRPQTLRKWAMTGSGPIQPIKIGNRLRWKLRDVLDVCKYDGIEL